MIKIKYISLLGGWFVVRGAHWAPLAGPFNSKAEALAWKNRPHDPGRKVVYKR